MVWLGSNICEGPLYGRTRPRWNAPGPWTKPIRDLVTQACTDLETLGGAYAEQIPALHALTAGTTPIPAGDETWLAPVRALIALEWQRLRLDDPTQPR